MSAIRQRRSSWGAEFKREDHGAPGKAALSTGKKTRQPLQQILRVMSQVIGNEGLDEPVGMVVARVLAQIQFLA